MYCKLAQLEGHVKIMRSTHLNTTNAVKLLTNGSFTKFVNLIQLLSYVFISLRSQGSVVKFMCGCKLCNLEITGIAA